ncbi:MAG: FeoA family protein [Fibrobacter sp.]|jgi:ferrous iron transport protein A|nr:FeoA family protein [Fibrobacter sp.]
MELGSCREGDRVRVLKMRGKGMIRKRLMEMGILKGAEIRIVKYAPLKDPIEIEIGDSHLSLRICEARFIDVERI